MADERPEVGPPRGVLPTDAPAARAGEHSRFSPPPALAPYLAHFWWIRWDLEVPRVVETLPHPTVHFLFESPTFRGEASGISLERFVRTLEGSGKVFGIKLRPAVFGALASGKLEAFRNRPTPLVEALASGDFSEALEGIGRLVAEAERIENALPAVEKVLATLAWPRLPKALEETRDLVERIEHDRGILRVADAASVADLDVRTLERRFREFVGLSPKTVIARYRLIEAAELLKTGSEGSLADLAASLGYTDQAHFSRDFRNFVGRTPGYVRSAGKK